MKVLVKQGGSTAGDIVTIPPLGGATFEALADGTPYEGKAIIAEVPDRQVAVVVANAVKKAEFLTKSDFNHDLNFIAKVCAMYENGTEVKTEATAKGYRLIPDESGRINRAEGLAEGDVVAIGPNVSPKALMNARGLVVAVNGKVEVELEESDLDRVKRATGKVYRNPVRFALSCVEKV